MEKTMKWIAIVGRTLLGLLYLFSVVNFIFPSGEMPSLNGDASNFVSAMMSSGFMNVVKVIEAIGALLLVSGQYVRLAALCLLPVTVNILLFHSMLAADSIGIPLAMLAVNLFLLFYYRDDLKVILKR